MLKVLVTRLTKEEIDLVKKVCEKEKRTMSSFIRKCTVDKANEVLKQE